MLTKLNIVIVAVALFAGACGAWFVRAQIADADRAAAATKYADAQTLWEVERTKATETALANERAAREKERELEKLRSSFNDLAAKRNAELADYGQRLRNEREAYLKRANEAAGAAGAAGDCEAAAATCMDRLAFVTTRVNEAAEGLKRTYASNSECVRFYEEVRAGLLTR